MLFNHYYLYIYISGAQNFSQSAAFITYTMDRPLAYYYTGGVISPHLWQLYYLLHCSIQILMY